MTTIEGIILPKILPGQKFLYRGHIAEVVSATDKSIRVILEEDNVPREISKRDLFSLRFYWETAGGSSRNLKIPLTLTRDSFLKIRVYPRTTGWVYSFSIKTDKKKPVYLDCGDETDIYGTREEAQEASLKMANRILRIEAL